MTNTRVDEQLKQARFEESMVSLDGLVGAGWEGPVSVFADPTADAAIDALEMVNVAVVRAIMHDKSNITVKETKMDITEAPLAEQIAELGIDTVVAAITASDGSSKAEDRVGTLSDLFDHFEFSRFEGLPEWKREALADRAAPTVWNEARREAERVYKAENGSAMDSKSATGTFGAWRIPNEAHIGQVWLTVDNDPTADRVWAYHTTEGKAALVLVQDLNDGSEQYARFGVSAVRKVADADEADEALREFRSAINAARDKAMAEFGDLDGDTAEPGAGDGSLAAFDDL